MKECWICRRTEEDFKRILKLDELDDDFFCPADIEDHIEKYEEWYGELNICPVCFEISYTSKSRAIQWIEDDHSDLFEWFDKMKKLHTE